MEARSFERLGGWMAILAAISGFLYTVSFIILRSPLASSLFLMLTGLLTTAALVALYSRLQNTGGAFALYALLMGFSGALGSAVHGGYDLAYNINPPSPAPPAEVLALPSPIDPRGLLTFGFACIGVLLFSWLISRSRVLPNTLGYVGYLSALMLAILYLGRLIILDPASPLILVPALLNGFIIGPLFYLWLGVALMRPATVVSVRYAGPERRSSQPSSDYYGPERRMGERAQPVVGERGHATYG